MSSYSRFTFERKLIFWVGSWTRFEILVTLIQINFQIYFVLNWSALAALTNDAKWMFSIYIYIWFSRTKKDYNVFKMLAKECSKVYVPEYLETVVCRNGCLLVFIVILLEFEPPQLVIFFSVALSLLSLLC